MTEVSTNQEVIPVQYVDDIPFSSEMSSDTSSEEEQEVCAQEFNTIYHVDLIENVCVNLKNVLSKCNFPEYISSQPKPFDPVEEVILKAHETFECSSEESSGILSVKNLNADDVSKLIIAVQRSESRKSGLSQGRVDSSSDFIFPIKFEPGKLKDRQDTASSKLQTGNSIDGKKISEITIADLPRDTEISSYSKVEVIPVAIHLIEPFFKFKLPTNLELLKDVNPLAYLEKYCWIGQSRLAYYQKIYAKYREKENIIIMSKLFLFLNDLLANTLTDVQFNILCDILEFNDNTIIETHQVYYVCAVAERMFFRANLAIDGNCTTEINKEFQETVDFDNINYKLRNYSIKPSLLNLFMIL